MRFGLKSGLLAASLLALSAPAFALNPQPEPPGVNHNPNQSVQYSNPTLTAHVSTTCGAASGAPNVVVGGTQAAGNMTARPAAAGGSTSNGATANVDKCATQATTMGSATPVPATH